MWHTETIGHEDPADLDADDDEHDDDDDEDDEDDEDIVFDEA